MRTFIALALQMGQELKDMLNDYWSRLSYTLCFKVSAWYETDFYTYWVFFILQTIHRDLMKVKNMT